MQFGEPNSLGGLQLTRVLVFSGLPGIQKTGVFIMTSPVKEKTGKVAGSPAVARDVTSHKQGEAASRLIEKSVLVASNMRPL